MTIETLHIGTHSIPCEINEFELNLHPADEKPITFLAFVLGRYSSDFLLGLRDQLWVSVARRYVILKNEIAAKRSSRVIGRISFECDDTRVEYEFSKLTRSALRSLLLIVTFVRQYPSSEEIRVCRDGPILVRFRTLNWHNASATSADTISRLTVWLAGFEINVPSYFRRKIWRNR